MQMVADLVRSVQELMQELQTSPTTELDNRVLGSLAFSSPSGKPELRTTEVHSSPGRLMHRPWW